MIFTIMIVTSVIVTGVIVTGGNEKSVGVIDYLIVGLGSRICKNEGDEYSQKQR